MNAGITALLSASLLSVEAVSFPVSAEAVREAPIPLHFGGAVGDLTILFILVGGLASSALATIGVLAFSQRQSRPYLFVSLALEMLAAKAFVGSLSIFHIVPVPTHHTVAHALDCGIALCLIIAIFYDYTVICQIITNNRGQ